jgi:SAM-dependent methyltransferase
VFPIDLLVGDVASPAFLDGSFDLVVSTLSMHHRADPTAGLSEIGRVQCLAGGRWSGTSGPASCLHGHTPDPVDHLPNAPLGVVSARPWRWP